MSYGDWENIIWPSMSPEEKKEHVETQLRRVKEKQMIYGDRKDGKMTFKYLVSGEPVNETKPMMLQHNNARVKAAAREFIPEEEELNKFMRARDIEKYFGNHFSAVANKIIGAGKNKNIRVPKSAAANVKQFVEKWSDAQMKGQTAKSDQNDVNANRRGLDTIVYQGEPEPNYKKEIKPAKNEFELDEEEQFAFDQEEKRSTGLNNILSIDDDYPTPESTRMRVPEFIEKYQPQPPTEKQGIGSLMKRRKDD